MKYYTIGILFNMDLSRVALILKNRPEWQNGLFNFPGGHLEEGELPSQCVSREIQEECWVKIPYYEWKEIGVISNPDNYSVHVFTAKTD